MKKRILALLMTMCLLVGLIPVVSAAEVASGTCGENLTWMLTEDGTLTISGEGEMDAYYDPTYSSGTLIMPWFSCRDQITSVVIQKGVTTVGRYTFTGCTNLTSVSLPNTLTAISAYAFQKCTALSSIALPDSVTSISNGAFSGCSNLCSVNLPDGCSLGKNAFSDTPFQRSFTDENGYAILDGVLIDYEYGKASHVIPDGVTRINFSVFSDDWNLKSITLPDSLKSIGRSAFSQCKNLTAIKLPNSLETIENGAFSGCKSLTEVLIPDGVVAIGDYSFEECVRLTDVTIGDGVERIGEGAFQSCTRLVNVSLGKNVSSIGLFAFTECYKLQSIAIPDSVTNLDVGAFSDCEALTEVRVGKGVAALNEAFSDCEGLSEIYFTGNPPYMTKYDFRGAGNVAAYYPVTDAWSDNILQNYGAETVNWIGYRLFNDVTLDTFFFKPVIWASTNNITSGATATTFNPGGDCLRAQVVTFLWRALGCPEPVSTYNPFVDVKESDFYYKAVLWAVENGITNGADDTHFNPLGVCNRAQVVTFLYRAFQFPDVGTVENPFTDVPDEGWYTAPVLWAVENEITNGISATKFGPNANCNRAQVVTFLYRAYN